MENKEKESPANKGADAQDLHENIDEHDEGIDDGQDHEHDQEHDQEKNDKNEKGDEAHELDEQLPPEIQQSSEQDARSVYVKNVDYSSTKEEVTEFFKSCGKITRVSIICDKYTGNPKGFAYIEFAEKEGAENALILSDSTFKGRNITVMPKRTNIPFKGRGGRGARRFGRGGGFSQ